MSNVNGNELVGVITSLENEFGFIDGNVFFTASVCQNHSLPKLNDRVKYTAKSREGKKNFNIFLKITYAIKFNIFGPFFVLRNVGG